MKNFSQKYSLDRIFPLIAIFISILAMFINIFFGFDVHHDGLSLSTLILTKEALLGSGPYPFNQYGPAWTIPYLPISLLIPIESLYLAELPNRFHRQQHASWDKEIIFLLKTSL